MLRKIIFGLTAAVFCSASFAATNKEALPLLNCNLKKVDHTSLEITLNTEPQEAAQVYLIKNTSSYAVLIDHSTGRRGASAGWMSSLEPGNWSAIAVAKKDFKLQCYISNNGKFDQTDCKLLKVCQPGHALTVKNSGDYWLAENQSWEKLTTTLRKRGVKI